MKPLGAHLILELLTRAKAGDQEAQDYLVEAHTPVFQRWARCRVPRTARHVLDTDELTQDTLRQVVSQTHEVEYTDGSSLRARMKEAVALRIRTQLAETEHQKPPGLVAPDSTEDLSSLREQRVGSEALARYEAALERLPPEYREAIAARLARQQSGDELARALSQPDASVARRILSHAILRLAEEMRRIEDKK